MNDADRSQLKSETLLNPEECNELALAKKRIRVLENQIYKLRSRDPEILKAMEWARLGSERQCISRSLLYSLPLPVFVLDEMDQFLLVNHTFEEQFFGLRREENNKQIRDVFPAEVCKQILQNKSDMHEGGGPRSFEWRHLAAGSEKVYDIRLFWVSDDDEPFGFGGMVLDVTDQQKASLQLEASETRFQELVEKTSNLVIQLDEEFRLVFANPATLNLLGITAEIGVGMNILDFMHAEDVDRVERAMNRSVSRVQDHLNLDNKVPSGEGKIHHILWSFQFTYSEEGELKCVNGIGRDITQRRRLETQMVKAKETAEAADRSKSEFLAMISHEIRTPLNSIIGLSGLLGDLGLPAEEQSMIETIGASGQSLLNLVNDVLDLSKVEAGRMILEREKMNLSSCLKQVDQLFAYRAETKGIEFNWKIDAEVPLTVCADKDRLLQVLNNLVGNALKFTSKGRVEIRVDAESLANVEELDLWGKDKDSMRPYRLKFEIEDTGIGISPEQRVLLFQPFSQADPSIRKRFGGTGLGLVISRKLAKLMGGDIDLSSELGQGSTFTFSLKVDGGAESIGKAGLRQVVEEGPENEDRVDRNLASRCPMKIVVVDDVSTNRLVMKTLLKRMGYEPELFESGLAAIGWIEENPVDLIFLDMVMPDLNGMDTARAIRHREYSNKLASKDIHIVALTANAMTQDREECLEAGMNEFMSKPVRTSLIVNCIERVYHESSARSGSCC
ncbi:MAG: ATP-binding protein [Opitutales bacterium]|nr:ATP-binding protein [Opitutales bacterium]